MSAEMKAYQSALLGLGYAPGPIDGLWGGKTRGAAEALIAANGRRGGTSPHSTVTDLPWMVEGRKVLGLHESIDKSALSRWLKLDGATLGDPSRLPWCGDFVQTAIRLALPSEAFPGALAQNPYWARNWALFGRATDPTYGAVLVFSRDGGGHVGFCVGQEGDYFAVLGGNQSNRVTIANVAKSRLLAARWPTTFDRQPIYLPLTKGGKITINEV